MAWEGAAGGQVRTRAIPGPCKLETGPRSTLVQVLVLLSLGVGMLFSLSWPQLPLLCLQEK